MEIVIKKACKGDSKRIANCFKELIKSGKNISMASNMPFKREKIILIEKEIREDKRNICHLIAEDISTKKVVGYCNFKGPETGRTKHRVDCGWFVHPNYMQRGIATKMLSALIDEAKRRGYKRMEAEIAVTNAPSIKLIEKRGFIKEGLKRSSILLDDGKFEDTFIFALLI